MELLIILGLILLNGAFSMIEMAMVSARRTKLEIQADKGNKKAKKVLKIMEHPEHFLSTIQIWITLIGILTGIFSGEKIQTDLDAFFRRFELLRPFSSVFSTTVIVIVVTYFTLVMGELLPKQIGLMQPERIARAMAPAVNILSRIMFPFIRLLSFSTKLLERLFGVKKQDSMVTEEEIKAIIEESAEQGGIEHAEQEIIERVFHLGDRSITSIMTHRSNIIRLNTQTPVEDTLAYIREHPFSVYPVCDGSIDMVTGFVRNRDLFALTEGKTLEEISHTALFVPENNSIYTVMELFKKTGTHVCFVVDEYGSLQGMVTLNDLFEAIVGDMPEKGQEEEEIILREDGSYWVDAHIRFYDFLDYFECEQMTTSFDTLAGFILHRLEHIPQTGEQLTWKTFLFEIADMDEQRIDKVLVRRKNADGAEDLPD
ncbi:MAG: hemolysin family protein [Bacteroidales bacterium]|jgi:putative hemolysin|nr:hemolysin family protein [Bacteroidales bacterium]